MYQKDLNLQFLIIIWNQLPRCSKTKNESMPSSCFGFSEQIISRMQPVHQSKDAKVIGEPKMKQELITILISTTPDQIILT